MCPGWTLSVLHYLTLSLSSLSQCVCACECECECECVCVCVCVLNHYFALSIFIHHQSVCIRHVNTFLYPSLYLALGYSKALWASRVCVCECVSVRVCVCVSVCVCE